MDKIIKFSYQCAYDILDMSDKLGLSYGEFCIYLFVILIPFLIFLFAIINIIRLKRWKIISSMLLILNIIIGILLFYDIQ